MREKECLIIKTRQKCPLTSGGDRIIGVSFECLMREVDVRLGLSCLMTQGCSDAPALPVATPQVLDIGYESASHRKA